MAKAKKKYDANAAKARERRLKQQEIEKSRAFWAKTKKPLMIGIPALIVAILIIYVAVCFLSAPTGRIHSIGGQLIGTGNNWIIVNTGSNSAPQSYKLAEYNAPEGYSPNPGLTLATTGYSRDQAYIADSPDALIQSLFVGPVPGISAADQAARALTFGLYVQPNQKGVHSGQLGGIDCFWDYAFQYDRDEEGNDLDTGFAYLLVYVDGPANSSVLVSMNTANGLIEDLPDEQAMLTEAEKLMKNLKMV